MNPITVPARFGLGCAPLAGLYAEVSEDDARATIDSAWELGVRVFDTAPLYGSGLSELRVGEALRGRPREEFVLSTKVGRLLVPGRADPMFAGAPRARAVFDFSRDGVLRSLEASLERLQLDRVDTVLIHDPDDHMDEALAHAYPVLEQLRGEGVVRSIGAGMNQSPALARFVRETDVDCVLVAGRWTLIDREAEGELLPLCAARGVDVLAGGVFNSGALARGGAMFDYAPASQEVLDRVGRVTEICARWEVPIEAAALQFPARHPAVTTVLVGCRSPAEVAEDVRLFGLEVPDGLWADV